MTQQQLCEAGGLSYSTLAKIERGAIRAPSVFTISKIAVALGLGVEELLATEPNQKPSRAGSSGETKSHHHTKFVYCDINGVLVRFYQRAFTALAHDSNQPLDLVEQAFWRYNDAVCKGDMSPEELERWLAESLEVETVDWRSYYVQAVEPIVEAQQYLAQLSKRMPVGLLSNIFSGYIDALFAAKKIPDLPYKVIVDSSQERVIKPQHEIYTIAEQKAGFTGNDILFIDDSRANIVAAQELGWRCIWFDSYHPNESIAEIQKILEVS